MNQTARSGSAKPHCAFLIIPCLYRINNDAGQVRVVNRGKELSSWLNSIVIKYFPNGGRLNAHPSGKNLLQM